MSDLLFEKIKKIRNNTGLSQEEFAKSIGVTRSMLSQIEIGRSIPTYTTLASIIHNYEIDANSFFEDETVPKTVPNTVPNQKIAAINKIGRGVPVYNVLATAGTPVLFDDEKEMAIGYIDMPEFNDCQGWVRVTGDSMYPKYRNGDYIAVKEQEDMSEITFGNAFYIILKEQKLLKYIRRHEKNNMIILRSENNKYDDLDLLRNKIVKLYRVKGLLRDID